MMDVSFQPVGGYGLVAFVAAVFLLLMAFAPAREHVSARRRMVLVGLRAAVFLLIVMAMLRPARVVTEVRQQPATIVLLVDQSRSMRVADTFGGKSRWEQARDSIEAAQPQLQRLAENLEVEIYAFGETLIPAGGSPSDDERLKLELPASPEGRQTAMGWVIEEVLRQEAGKRLLATLLLSDGAQRAYAPRDTPPQTAVRRMADVGCPLYTFAFGQARGLGDIRDVALSDLVVNQSVYVKNVLQVRASLRAEGHVGRPISVQLAFETSSGEMEVVAAEEFVARSSDQLVPVSLRYIPQQPGEYKLTLRTPPLEGELVTTNNELSTFVTVREGGINVLYLEGELRRERTFLARSLGASPNIRLDAEWIDKRTRDRWPVDMGQRLAPGAYDVVIIGDLDSAALSDDWLATLADRVDAGTGLMMLGGLHSFGPGGYQNTPLADVLPITMDRLERQRFGEPVSKDLHVAGPVRPVPAEALAIGASIVALAAGEDNVAAWRKLPPLEGANRFRGRKPNAAVLLESDDATAVPLLVAGTWGGGRVLAFAGDSTWRWTMDGYSAEHRRFWRQAVLWLAKKDASQDKAVWIQLDTRRYRPGAPVTFVVGASDSQGMPLPDATLQVNVVAPDGQRYPVRLDRRQNQTAGTFRETRLAGDYTIEVQAEADGQQVGQTRARVLVYEQDLELDNPAADPTLLSSLAAMTAGVGGEALVPEQLTGLMDALVEKPRDLRVETQHKQNYWDTWPFFLLLVTLLGTDWYLRKQWGLA